VRVLAAFLSVASAAAQEEPPSSGESYALFQGLHATRRIHFSVPSGPCTAAVQRLAARLRGTLVSFDPEPCDPAAVRFLVGAPTDPDLLPCAEACGVEPLVGGFRVLGRDFARPGDALVGVIEDPLHAGRPLCFVLGNDLELVSAYLDEVPRLTRPHLWVHDDGELALECPLAPDGHPRAEEANDYRARRAQYFEGTWRKDEPDQSVHLGRGIGRERWIPYAAALTRVRRRVARWFGASEAPACEIFVYAHQEDFEACLGTSAFSLTNRLRPRVHVLLAPGLPEDGGAGLARALARSIAGAPAAEWLEDGLAVAATELWWQRPLDAWVAHLSAAKLLPPVNEVFAADAAERFSEHALLPARGLFFRQSVQNADARFVRALWKGALGEPERNSALYQRAIAAAVETTKPARRRDAKGAEPRGRDARAPDVEDSGAEDAGSRNPGAKDPGARETRARESGVRAAGSKGSGGKAAGAKGSGAPLPGARQTAETAEEGEQSDAQDRKPLRERRQRPGPYRHGLALVEDGLLGYGSRAADGAIAEAHALDPGPDALSLTVFATTEDPLAPLCPARARAVHGSASDLALASTAAAARTAEMSLLLSLEVLAGPSGAWADVLSWTGVDEPARFWERYGLVAQHYALLCELLGIEAFSFGSNLRDSARTEGALEERNPELAEQRRAGWKDLIVRLRATYGGTLVFTSRSPAEAEETSFLEELDALGLFLYPRGLGAAPDEAELRRVLRFDLQKAIDLGVRWNRPLLLVQVGFPARADSWSNPMVPRGALDLDAQARYFEALADVLAQKLDNAATLRGTYLWNWPCDPARAGALDAGFSLRKKPVESALRRLFAR
jgi:hypothetical protein